MGKSLEELRFDLILSLGDDPETPVTYSDDDFLDIKILESCRVVSRIKPLYDKYVIPIVNGEYFYTLPVDMYDCRDIVLVNLYDGSQSPIEFSFDKYRNKVQILESLSYIQDSTVEALVTRSHTLPSEDEESTFSEYEDMAIIMYSIGSIIDWVFIRQLSSSGGASSFKVGRYEEKSDSKSLNTLITTSKELKKNALDILEREDSKFVFSSGDVSSLVPLEDLRTLYLGSSGYTTSVKNLRYSTSD